MNRSDLPKVSVAEMQRLLAGELSLRMRLGYTALLLVALAMTGVVGSLWLTEPALPLRTQAAFAMIIGIGLSWVVYAVWVLTHRRVLFAGHRIIAARMAIAFTTTFVAASLSLGFWGPAGRAAYGAAAFGAVMLAIAVVMLRTARRRFAELTRRRHALEHEVSALTA